MLLNVDIQIVNHQYNQVLNYQQQLDPVLHCFGQMILIGVLQQKVMVDLVSSNESIRSLFIIIELLIDGVKPGDNTQIYIPRGIWLVADYPLPRILSLRIDGVLEFEQV
jgi:hypothetical protein